MSSVSAPLFRSLTSPLAWFESVGRTVTDFGFGSLVGKYEEYFGRGVTRALLIVVGFGVVAAGIGATWQWLIAPLLTFFNTPVWGQTLISLVWRAAGLGAAIAVGLFLTSAILEWRRSQRTKAVLEDARQVLNATKAQGARHNKEMEQVFAKADGMLETAFQFVEENAKVRIKTADVMDAALKNARELSAQNEKLTKQERAEAEEMFESFERELEDFRRGADMAHVTSKVRQARRSLQRRRPATKGGRKRQRP